MKGVTSHAEEQVEEFVDVEDEGIELPLPESSSYCC
jgi:hypothetical protein